MRRLPIPAALGVAVVATATCASLVAGGCGRRTDPVDASPVMHGLDASPGDGAPVDSAPSDTLPGDGAMPDAGLPPPDV